MLTRPLPLLGAFDEAGPHWWTLEGVATPLFQSSIGNQSATAGVAAKGRAVQRRGDRAGLGRRSISPCCWSAEKSRARFFAPLRCAQNDSTARCGASDPGFREAYDTIIKRNLAHLGEES